MSCARGQPNSCSAEVLTHSCLTPKPVFPLHSTTWYLAIVKPNALFLANEETGLEILNDLPKVISQGLKKYLSLA
jgi:hypothetical protein